MVAQGAHDLSRARFARLRPARFARGLAAHRNAAVLALLLARFARSYVLASHSLAAVLALQSRPHRSPSLRSGGCASARGSPVASRRPCPAASLCPFGACFGAPPRLGRPFGARCPSRPSSRLGRLRCPLGTLGRCGGVGCRPLPRPPSCWGRVAPPLPPLLRFVGREATAQKKPVSQPATPPPTPPAPSLTPRG